MKREGRGIPPILSMPDFRPVTKKTPIFFKSGVAFGEKIVYNDLKELGPPGGEETASKEKEER